MHKILTKFLTYTFLSVLLLHVFVYFVYLVLYFMIVISKISINIKNKQIQEIIELVFFGIGNSVAKEYLLFVTLTSIFVFVVTKKYKDKNTQS